MNKVMLMWQIIILYALIATIVYFISNYSIFVPPPSTYDDNATIRKIKTSSGQKISALYLQNTDSENVIIYSHGNAEDLGMIRTHAQQFYNLGFSVLAYDYSGYGTSDGSPSENATYENIQAVYDYALTQLDTKPENVILYGRSLGAGPTVDLATNVEVGALILESPFVSAFRVVTYIPIFPIDKYNNIRKIKNINAPILFIHGTNDSVIPFWHGQKLYDVYEGPKESYWVEEGGHNDISVVGGDEYLTKIKEFIHKYVQ